MTDQEMHEEIKELNIFDEQLKEMINMFMNYMHKKITEEEMAEICKKMWDCIPDKTSEANCMLILYNFICCVFYNLNKDEVNHHKVVLEKIDIFCTLLKKGFENYMIREATKGK